jgi:hypothetical protein
MLLFVLHDAVACPAALAEAKDEATTQYLVQLETLY